MIAMITIGCLLIPFIGGWEFYFAKRPVIARRFLLNRTVIIAAWIGFFDFFFDESFSLGLVVALAAISCSPICAGLVVCSSFVINMSQYEVRQVTSASPGSPPAQCRTVSELLTDAAVVYPADWFKVNLLDIGNWYPRE